MARILSEKNAIALEFFYATTWPMIKNESGLKIMTKGPPKYRAVYDALLRAIRRGEYTAGSRLPTEAELLSKFKVSRITVIRALRDLETAGLVRRRRGSGSYVEGPRQTEMAGIGMIFPPLEPGSIFSTVHQVLARESQKIGWQILFHEIADTDTPEFAAGVLDRLFAGPVRGLFYLPLPVHANCALINEAVARQCEVRKLPLVLLDRDIHHLHDRSRFDVIGSDNELGGFLAAQHLMQRGCRRILFFTDAREHPTVEARWEGVRNAVGRAESATVNICSGDGDDAVFVAEVLAKHKPDGIACVNDMTAAKVQRSLLRQGIKIPQQIKLTGFDDTSMAALLSVPLTTVRQSSEAMAIQAINIMRQRLERPDLSAVTLSIACSLVVRDSSDRTK